MITPSGITANLVPYGTSMITRGYEQNLTLDPGTYSVDRDGNAFNASVSDEVRREQLSFNSLSIPHRTGSINTIVGSTACRIFQISMARCWPSMTLEWTHTTHPAWSPIMQYHRRGNI